METISYEYEGALYVNLTNRCDCACVFCLRHNGHKGSIYADDLWLDHEPTREEALEAARALVEKGRLDQDERVGRNKAPVLLSEEDKARFLLLLERGKALLPLDRYALLGEVAEVEERLLFRAPFADPKNALKSLEGKRVRLHATPLNDPEAESTLLAEGPLAVDGEGIAVGSFRLSVPPETPIEGLALEEAFFVLGETRYYLYSLEAA